MNSQGFSTREQKEKQTLQLYYNKNPGEVGLFPLPPSIPTANRRKFSSSSPPPPTKMAKNFSNPYLTRNKLRKLATYLLPIKTIDGLFVTFVPQTPTNSEFQRRITVFKQLLQENFNENKTLVLCFPFSVCVYRMRERYI